MDSPAEPHLPPQDRQQAAAGRVVHVIGRLTEETFAALSSATRALARSGTPQAVVTIDDALSRDRLADIHQVADLVLAPSTRGPLRQWREMFNACRETVAGGQVRAVLAHGGLPGLVGAWAMRRERVRAPVFCLPGSGATTAALQGGLGALLLSSRQWSSGQRSSHAREGLAAPTEPKPDRWAPLTWVDEPVSEAFFAVPRQESEAALIVSGSALPHPRSVALFTQLAVLMNTDELHVGFQWVGTADVAARARLKAAQVSVFDVSDDGARAARLASAWVYVAPCATPGHLRALAEAMAAGLPCVALDCAQHRRLVRDGETGLLFRTGHDLVERIAELVDDPMQRDSLGHAAREQARRRFAGAAFCARLLQAPALALAAPPVGDFTVKLP